MKFLSLFGKKCSKKSKKSTSSASSASSVSSASDSLPRTPSHHSMQDTRGLFRTIEPIWYYHTTVAKHFQNQEWIRFDEHSQKSLENDYQTQPQSSLTRSSLGPCTVVFNQVSKKDKRTKLHPMKDRHESMPTMRNTHIGQTFELNKHVRRTISPIWWFEQDLADGSKGMCRFDDKNQVRLEALSEGRTRLTLQDDAFDTPFTVVLDDPKERELKEEVRGYLYFELDAFHIPLAKDMLQDSYFDDALTRRFSI